MIRMMQTGDQITGPVNLGNPFEFTILDLAKKIITMTGSKSEICFLPLPQDDPIQRRPDISLAQETLDGWSPVVELEAGLELTIKYFDHLLNN